MTVEELGFDLDEMSLDEYQTEASEFAFYEHDLLYPVLGLNGEAGEVAEKVKKLMRDKEVFTEDGETDIDHDDKQAIAYELGDVLWYVANIANDIDYSLEEIAVMNLEKLNDRRQRNSLRGSGDNR